MTAEIDRWTICHFCKKFARCERWFSRWRCSECRATNEQAQAFGARAGPDV